MWSEQPLWQCECVVGRARPETTSEELPAGPAQPKIAIAAVEAHAHEVAMLRDVARVAEAVGQAASVESRRTNG
jgi:hypothetical protein